MIQTEIVSVTDIMYTVKMPNQYAEEVKISALYGKNLATNI